MKIEMITPSRIFEQRVASGEHINIKHSANIQLDADEIITFTSDSGSEYDILRKSWGYYATPSLNGRLPRKALRPCLTRNRDGKYFILLVEVGQETSFQKYVKCDHHTVVAWLDSDETLEKFENATPDQSDQ